MVWNSKRNKVWFGVIMALFGTLTFTISSSAAPKPSQHDALPSHAQLRTALQTAGSKVGSGGFRLNVGATVVNQNGIGCTGAFSDTNSGGQCPGNGQSDDPIAMAYYRMFEQASRK